MTCVTYRSSEKLKSVLAITFKRRYTMYTFYFFFSRLRCNNNNIIYVSTEPYLNDALTDNNNNNNTSHRVVRYLKFLKNYNNLRYNIILFKKKNKNSIVLTIKQKQPLW